MSNEDQHHHPSQPEDEELSIQQIIDRICGKYDLDEDVQQDEPVSPNHQQPSDPTGATPSTPARSSRVQTDEDDALAQMPPAGTTDEDATQEQQPDDPASTVPLEEEMLPGTPHHRSLWKLLIAVGLIGLLAGTSIAVAFSYWLPASITIVPQTQVISTTTTVTVTTSGIPDPAKQQVAGRQLPAITMSQAHTVQTTGKGHHEAQTAHGFITFYNAALVAQSVPAGTLLVGADGVQIVTDQFALIPAGSLSTNGHTTVSAHALQAGPAGNIKAGDIYGACCRANVFAANSAFSGGQAARDYPMVGQQDIEGAMSSNKANLQQSVQAAFSAQVHPDEQLVTPSTCQTSVHPDHTVGSEATQVSVTVTINCTGWVYQSQPMQQVLEQVMSQQGAKPLETGYRRNGDIHLEVIDTKQQAAGTITLQIKASGTWAYQFTSGQLQHLAQLVSGKTRAEATDILVHAPGIAQVMLHTEWNQDRLPKDAGHIQVSVMYVSTTA